MSKIRQINEIGTGISLLKNDRKFEEKKTFKNSIMFLPTNIIIVTTEMSCIFNLFIYFYRYEIMMVFDFEECFEEVNLT